MRVRRILLVIVGVSAALINGVIYLEYVLGSEDFDKRLRTANSRGCAVWQTHKGYIALQGDHGEVSFRNIKVRPISSGNGRLR